MHPGAHTIESPAFATRTDAGRQLATALRERLGQPDGAVVYGLPRGGVVVAAEVARDLELPLDVFLVRKVGHPFNPELAIAAVGEGDVMIDVTPPQNVTTSASVTHQQHDEKIQDTINQLHAQQHEYASARPHHNIANRTAIIVDDGLATGATMRAAIEGLRQREPKRIIAAVPVGASSLCDALERYADYVVCLVKPIDFEAVGLWYENFSEVTTEQVKNLLLASKE